MRKRHPLEKYHYYAERMPDDADAGETERYLQLNAFYRVLKAGRPDIANLIATGRATMDSAGSEAEDPKLQRARGLASNASLHGGDMEGAIGLSKESAVLLRGTGVLVPPTPVFAHESGMQYGEGAMPGHGEAASREMAAADDTGDLEDAAGSETQDHLANQDVIGTMELYDNEGDQNEIAGNFLHFHEQESVLGRDLDVPPHTVDRDWLGNALGALPHGMAKAEGALPAAPSQDTIAQLAAVERVFGGNPAKGDPVLRVSDAYMPRRGGGSELKPPTSATQQSKAYWRERTAREIEAR